MYAWLMGSMRSAGDDVSRKRIASLGIVDGRLTGGRKISNTFRRGWNLGVPVQRVANTCSLIVAKPEKFVLDERTAQSSAKLILLVGSLGSVGSSK